MRPTRRVDRQVHSPGTDRLSTRVARDACRHSTPSIEAPPITCAPQQEQVTLIARPVARQRKQHALRQRRTSRLHGVSPPSGAGAGFGKQLLRHSERDSKPARATRPRQRFDILPGQLAAVIEALQPQKGKRIDRAADEAQANYSPWGVRRRCSRASWARRCEQGRSPDPRSVQARRLPRVAVGISRRHRGRSASRTRQPIDAGLAPVHETTARHPAVHRRRAAR